MGRSVSYPTGAVVAFQHRDSDEAGDFAFLVDDIADLTHLTYRKAPGPSLVRSDADPMNMRIRIIRLTPKGEKAVAAILGEG